ncbi:unnamed protein product [Schistocephalus solidus]|uniref:Uncharacterized protein n=1 Tax=Schistocephalus solidus TaxID=70667 RepID=A0A183SHW7_SCHSO|nr:unnamed protein product [Schistocephalus solidus]
MSGRVKAGLAIGTLSGPVGVRVRVVAASAPNVAIPPPPRLSLPPPACPQGCLGSARNRVFVVVLHTASEEWSLHLNLLSAATAVVACAYYAEISTASIRLNVNERSNEHDMKKQTRSQSYLPRQTFCCQPDE